MKFKVFADFKNPADRKYEPEWETEIDADTIGNAYSEGLMLFRAHCDEAGLDHELFEVHARTP